MKDGLMIGTEYSRTLQVDRDRTIAFMGEQLRVYATPSMVADVEYACRDLLVQFHDSGEDSVGARVEIDHLGPTLLGQTVTVKARVIDIALPRVNFEIEVKDELDTVGRSKHTRFVVDMAKQGERLTKKAARIKAAAGG
jgi:fluoroacetyl-CoA thioesterase